jgi:methyltransferase (TIGR00027 family)
MDEERPSFTAEGAAIMRALHQTLDGEPKILDDWISLRLVDPHSDIYKTRIEFLEHLPEPIRLQLKAAFVMRSRYAEDCLQDAFDNSVRQYVLLGAGLDTFAYRQPSWASSLRIFEVDHPATQRWKRRRLTEGGISVPDNLSFVPVDFEKVSLAATLPQVGVDFSAPIFFSMMGVSQYLTEAALDQTLRLVLSAPAPSEIVFSFVASDDVLPADDVALVKAFTAQFAAVGEPWLSRFHFEQLAAKLSKMGFSRILRLTPEMANQRYFQNRQDGLNAALAEQMIRASV